jgi:hypothetical protein
MKKFCAWLLVAALLLSLAACGASETVVETTTEPVQTETAEPAASAAPEETPAAQPEAEPEAEPETPAAYAPTEEELAERAAIEDALNLANNADQTWTYTASADAWVLSVVPAVVDPVLPDQQGVSVCVPGGYVTGIDTNGDGSADITAADGEAAVQGSLVIDYDAEIVSTNGQTYTAESAPLILTTGAAGYGSQNNAAASTTYAADGYIAISCGNRGKQDSVKDADGNVLYYTGDAPSCLADQKAAARFVKYNILLGNLPGNVDLLVSTGGSGGAAHATMFATTSNNPDFYDYQIEAGAVGVYRNSDGSYSTTVTIDGQPVELSDGAWGTVAYSAITPLYEGDMAQAFEYYMDTTYEFNTPFQAQLAQYLSEAYMDYINEKNLTVDEDLVGFDLNGDGDQDDTIALSIECDPDQYPETNGYHGTYLDLYLAEFTENLQWYLDNLDYAEGWTWFDENGAALSDEAVAAMTGADKATAFLEGRYTKGATGGMGGGPGGMGGKPDGLLLGGLPDGLPGDLPDGLPGDLGDNALGMFGAGIRDGGPGAGSTASAGGGSDSANYASYDEMVAAYAADVAEIYAGDDYGKNLVYLYNPLNYIGAEGTEDPTWTRIVMGAVEGDMPMMTSLNLQLAWLNSGVDAVIEWQWDGGHVPNEILGESLALYVDEMYGKYVSGKETTKAPAAPATANGDSTEASGTDLSSWVNYDDLSAVSFTLADVLAYRNTGASKAVPGFDVLDYGQEDYVFGNKDVDARHWDEVLCKIFEEHADTLAPLFNASEE